MSEVMEIDECDLRTTQVGSGEEFYDAVDDESIKDDDDDFFKRIDIAISGNKSPVNSPKEIPEAIVPPKTTEIVTNGEKESNGSISHSVNDKEDEELIEDLLDKPDDEEIQAEIADKLEEDLLKDPEDDLESVGKEAEDLLAAALDDEVELDKNELDNLDKDLNEISNPDSTEISDKNSKEVTDLPDKKLEEEKVPEICEEPAKAIVDDESTPAVAEKDSPEVEMENSVDDKEVTEEKSTATENETETPKTPAEDPAQAISSKPATSETVEDDTKADDLLVACESPKASQTMSEQDQQDCESVSSSALDETPEESCDEKQPAAETSKAVNEEQQKDEDEVQEVVPEAEEKVESMEVDETPTEPVEKPVETPPEEDSPELQQISKEFIPLKLKFVKHFSSTVGQLSRDELEELVLQKITESIMFCSENTDLRSRLEKQEKLCENFKKRLDNVKKQYNDLEMIHNRVMKDLKERPDAPITPVKITRAVGLQVYQPTPRSKPSLPSPTILQSKPSNKRPMDHDFVNGKGSNSDAKRKKTQKITPLRPPLSEADRARLEAQEANEEAKLRTNVSKTIIGASPGGVGITPSVTMTPINSLLNGSAKKTPTFNQSIDLTDEDEGPSSSGKVQQPPALVAIRPGTNQNPGQRTYLLKTNQPGPASRQNLQFRGSPVIPHSRHPAPLPVTPVQISRPGLKKIPPKPTIKINNVPNGIIVSWAVESLSEEHADINSYQIYAYEVTNSPPSSDNWRHVGDVKALLLPMAVTLTQFQEGQKYFFAVRAVDAHKRLSHFSIPQTWQ